MIISPRKALALLLFCASAFAQAEDDSVVREDIVFLEPDGRSYTSYFTVRSNKKSYTLNFPDGNSLDEFVYIYPNDYEYEEAQGKTYRLRFNQGSYAMMRPGYFDETRVSIDKQGVYTYTNWDAGKEEKPADKHFGMWNSPFDFTHYSLVWVLPEGFEFVDHKSNRKGEWVQRKNSLAWYGNNVNNIVFTIRYRADKDFKPQQQAETTPQFELTTLPKPGESLVLTLENARLFEAGRARLSRQGRKTINEVAATLKDQKNIRIQIEGHSDNVPIRGALAKRYPSNWELSSARASAVLRQLEKAGLDAKMMAIRAYADQHPIASNDTAEGKAKNRRIEIRVISVVKE